MTPAVQIFAINLLPVLGAIVFGWSALSLILIYWIENLIIGAINALKMLIAGGTAGWVGLLAGLFLTAFFAVHYGFFCYAHGTMIWGLFGNGLEGADSKLNTMGLWAATWEKVSTDRVLLWAVALLGAFHVYAFARYWLGARRWETADPATQMFAPYPRIFVVHVTIMLGGVAVLASGQPAVAVALLALLKTILETGHARFLDAAAQNPAFPVKAREILKRLGEHAPH